MQPSAISILIVDDSTTQVRILNEMLARLGFRTIDTAEDGRSALVKLQGRAYGLIISDLHMEPMGGLELLREVRRLRTPGTHRFIMITTEGTWGSQTNARLEGADAFLVKPFTIEALKAKIELVLARSSGRTYQKA